MFIKISEILCWIHIKRCSTHHISCAWLLVLCIFILDTWNKYKLNDEHQAWCFLEEFWGERSHPKIKLSFAVCTFLHLTQTLINNNYVMKWNRMSLNIVVLLSEVFTQHFFPYRTTYDLYLLTLKENWQNKHTVWVYLVLAHTWYFYQIEELIFVYWKLPRIFL